MNKKVRRGYVLSDEKEFSSNSIGLLQQSQGDLSMLLERGYAIDKSIVFVGNHYGLSKRQRGALVRSTSTRKCINMRKNKLIKNKLNEKTLHIDGLNLIITLEVALSNSTLILGMDGTIRDIAGLHGTYSLIDKTDVAINLIGETLEELEINKAIFYLDSPVSNSGRLKQRLLLLLDKYNFLVEVHLVKNADVELENKNYVVSTDAIILNRCISWINLTRYIIDKKLKDYKYIDLSMNE